MKGAEISKATIGRIPVYLKYLKTVADSENISATALANGLNLGEVQVRKDLSAVCKSGRPRTGYNKELLISALEDFLGAKVKSNVIIVGAGKLGRALLGYGGFAEYGLNISAAFDSDEKKLTGKGAEKPVLPLENLEGYCAENGIEIGIITVPADSAQSICDRLVGCGIKAIWCFAPCALSVPDGVTVQYENMALSLAFLDKKLKAKANN